MEEMARVPTLFGGPLVPWIRHGRGIVGPPGDALPSRRDHCRCQSNSERYFIAPFRDNDCWSAGAKEVHCGPVQLDVISRHVIVLRPYGSRAMHLPILRSAILARSGLPGVLS